VRARGAGAFPDPQRPRVLWVGLEDPTAGLAGVQRVVEERMTGLGFAREDRAFSPHLTLGRVKDGHADVTALLAAAQDRQFGTTVVREVVLYESRLRSQGAEYVALRRVPLGGRAAERAAEGTPPRAPSPPHANARATDTDATAPGSSPPDPEHDQGEDRP
jgi:2'-5' RNA ligase